MLTSKVTKKGLTTIPIKVRRALKIEEGDILIWEINKENNIAIIKVLKDPLKRLKGKYNDPNLTYDKIEELADRLIAREAHASN